MKQLKYFFGLLIAFLTVSLEGQATETFITFNSGDFLLIDGQQVTIGMDANDERGVAIAIHNLQSDIKRATGSEAVITNNADARIVAGTLGHSKMIDALAKKKVFNAKDLKGKNEKYIITSAGNQLIIAGSDRRGTIYGIYELSRQLGVSPWYWWADVPTVVHERAYVKRGVFTDGEPAVRYRGIFLNDEAPCLTSWVKNYFGTDFGGHEFYAHVFELILRLKGNFMWPAMWMWAFYADDPENSKTADEMGVMMGTSHHEPMARNHQEWARHRAQYGAWNYQTNQQVIDQFFREGIQRMKGTEDVVTIGMRGDGDEAMSAEADTRLMKRIVDNQRKIIAKETGKKAEKTPQVWALYKEVLDYYDKGMKVPDDVTIMLCDDNWGNVRRVPNAIERKHPGGWGLYYHVDYVGAPRNSKWLNVTPTQNMWEQLTLAYDYGMDRVWILNVGDLKPMEYPITFFMDMAWNPKEYGVSNVKDHTVRFCEETFGEEQAQEAARILDLYGKYAGRSTAEMLDAGTYNIETGEWQQVADQWMRLETEALRQFLTLKAEQRDAYEQLILFPVQAMSNIYQMYHAQAMNLYLAGKKDPDANLWADRCVAAFHRDSVLSAHYNHDIANGKWRGMMTQKHIGYRSWNDDFAPNDVLPRIVRVENREPGGYTFRAENGVVSMEAEHYYSKTDAAEAQWNVLDGMGRTRSAMLLLPHTSAVDGASLSYRFTMPEDVRNVKVHIVVKSTLDFLNKGGLCYSLSLDGSEAKVVNFNSNLNEDPKNIYSIYYPTVARRVVESVVEMDVTKKDVHTLTLKPLDPGIVVEKIVVDCGGYKPSFLFMNESPF